MWDKPINYIKKSCCDQLIAKTQNICQILITKIKKGTTPDIACLSKIDKFRMHLDIFYLEVSVNDINVMIRFENGFQSIILKYWKRILNITESTKDQTYYIYVHKCYDCYINRVLAGIIAPTNHCPAIIVHCLYVRIHDTHFY